MMINQRIVVLCHLFYPDKHEDLFDKLEYLKSDHSTFFFNIVHAGFDRTGLLTALNRRFPGSFIIQTPNKGRDIGGKFSLLNAYMQSGVAADLLLFIHDKQSPHIVNPNYWVKELLKVIDKKNLGDIFSLFNEKKDCGIVCAGKFIQNEHDPKTGNFSCSSNDILKSLLRQHALTMNSYDFVAGTIFWTRAGIYERHFREHDILEDIGQLESGNALDFDKGTYIHAWERFLSWIVLGENYKIYGI